MVLRRPSSLRGAVGPASLPSGTDVRLLPRLTALRAFAALSVFVYHLEFEGVVSIPGGWTELGFLGVTFFFVLSGFVLAWGTRPDLPARKFWRRRFARVYPSDLVMLAVAMAVPVVPVYRDAEAAVANVLLVQAWWRADDVAYGMNGVSWSLSCEAFFYVIFPLAALVVRRLPRGLSWSLAASSLGLAVVAYLVRPGFADHLPLVRVSEFLLGLVAGIAVRDGWRPHVPGVAAAAVLIVGLAIAAALPGAVGNAVVAVPFLLVVLHMARRDLEGRPGWLPCRMMVFAGEASFAFYLVHELVIVNLAPLLRDAWAVQVAIMSTAAVVAAVTLHLLVERPCNRLLRDRAPSLALTTSTDGSGEPSAGRSAGETPPREPGVGSGQRR